MSWRAWDRDGKELFPVFQAVVVPAARITAARQIASAYIRDVEQAVDYEPAKMLPTALSTTGRTPATHYACFRQVLSNQMDLVEQRIAEQSVSWAATKRLNLANATDLAAAKTRFAVIEVADEEEFSRLTGLKRIQ